MRDLEGIVIIKTNRIALPTRDDKKIDQNSKRCLNYCILPS